MSVKIFNEKPYVPFAKERGKEKKKRKKKRRRKKWKQYQIKKKIHR